MKITLLALGATLGVAAFADRTPAFTMRFDDNRDPRTWKTVCDSFAKRGMVCSLAVNCAGLNDAQWKCLKELSGQGHEVMDHTPSHALYGMALPDAASFEKAKALACIADSNAEKRYVCFRPVVDLKHPKNTRRRLTVKDSVIVPAKGQRFGFYVNIVLPGQTNPVSVFTKDGQSTIVDFWKRPLKEKVNLDNADVLFLDDLAITPTDEQLRLMAKMSVDAFTKHGVPSPKTNIRPGGWYPGIRWDVLKKVYGDEFGYVCADARPGAPRPGVLSVTDPETVAGKWSMCYDGYFFDKGPEVTPEMVADHIQKRLAEGRSLVILSHLWANKLPGKQKEMLEKIDRLAAILAERKVPVCTHSELAVRTFGR